MTAKKAVSKAVSSDKDYLEIGKCYLEITDSDMYQGYTEINYCPMCSRKMRN